MEGTSIHSDVWTPHCCPTDDGSYTLSYHDTPLHSSFLLFLPLLRSPLLLHTWRSGWLQLFAIHFLVRRLLSAARAILCPHNAAFSLTLIKVHLASKCCGPLNTDCTEKRKWKRQSQQRRQREMGGGRERKDGEIMVIEEGQNNDCSLTSLNIGLMWN